MAIPFINFTQRTKRINNCFLIKITSIEVKNNQSNFLLYLRILTGADMKFASLCLLAAAFLAVPCYSAPFFMELPGYAKTVVGAFGK